MTAISAFAADERPSWAVVNAVDRLIAKHALFLPGRDGFVKNRDGDLVQYELPSKSYLRDGKDWRVDLLSQRWRKEDTKEWGVWLDARPKYGNWRIAVIRVAVPSSGVTASWVEGDNFIGGTAPGEAEVMQRLNTQGQGQILTPANGGGATVVRSIIPPRTHTVPVRPSRVSGGGMFRKRADGSLERVTP